MFVHLGCATGLVKTKEDCFNESIEEDTPQPFCLVFYDAGGGGSLQVVFIGLLVFIEKNRSTNRQTFVYNEKKSGEGKRGVASNFHGKIQFSVCACACVSVCVFGRKTLPKKEKND